MMQNIKQLMDQICTPHLVFHYKVLSHWIVIILAIFIAFVLSAVMWAVLEEYKHSRWVLGVVALVVVITTLFLIIFIQSFWNLKTKTWYDATVNSSSVFNREKQEVAKEYSFCDVIEERDDIDKPLYFVFCNDEATIKHIDNQINRLDDNGSVVFLNSNLNTVVIRVTNYKNVKTKYKAMDLKPGQSYVHLPQSYSVVNQKIVLDDPATDSNIVNTNQLNSNLIELFNGSN